MKKMLVFALTTLLFSVLALADDTQPESLGRLDEPTPMDCSSVSACMFNRAGTPCESKDCPAVKVDVGQMMDGGFAAQFYLGSSCTGDPGNSAAGVVLFPSQGTVILYMPLDACDPMGTPYSMNWVIGMCNATCGDYACGTAQPACDDDGSQAPAANLLDFLVPQQ